MPKVIIEECIYERLMEDQKKLKALEGAGVDNWEGYEIAMEEIIDDN